MAHYDITMGNDVARDVHCEIIMGYGIVRRTYDVTMHTDVATTLIYYVISMPNYDIFVFLVKSLIFYIKFQYHQNRSSTA